MGSSVILEYVPRPLFWFGEDGACIEKHQNYSKATMDSTQYALTWTRYVDSYYNVV